MSFTLPNSSNVLLVEFEVEESAPKIGYKFEGHVDFYGYHSLAGGWFVGGWITHPWPLGHRPQNAIAHFAEISLAEHTHSVFYHREDVSGRGVGFVFFFRSTTAWCGTLRAIRIDCAGSSHSAYPTPDVLELTGLELVDHLDGLLAGGEDGTQRQELHALLFGERQPESVSGFIDFYGFHAAAGGWLLCGWVSIAWKQGCPPERVIVSFEEGDVGGESFAILYPRHDLADRAEGVALFVRGDATLRGKLCAVSFEAGAIKATLYAAPMAARLREPELLARLRPVLAQAPVGSHRDILNGLLARQPYRGEDTLAGLGASVFIEIDEAILAGPDGLVMMGWSLAKPSDVRAIRVRSGPLITPFDLGKCIRISRPDVLEGFGEFGFDDPCCGFIAFLPHAVFPGARVYIEVETTQHEVGYRNVPRPKLEGIAAIKRLLAAVDVRFSEVNAAFDHVLGPAVERLNRTRLACRPDINVIEYGAIPAQPRFSVIVPLYGRLDFVEYQLALFSANPRYAVDVELIYVLDEPARRREAQFLFTSVYERFLVPFKAALLDQNVGFAPANNIGLAQARGTYIAYLNSDVFPGTLDWLERLAHRLDWDPTIGVIGPVLLFEDGSVQHRGMYFSKLLEFGDWYFGMHLDKGLRLEESRKPQAHLSITGACMVMPRALAEQVGGFDETYVIGDFEDSDLCLKLQVMGYRCVVDPGVRLFHLERKSQASSALGWRTNLTVYNAWQHQRRWGETIAARQAAIPSC